MSLLKSPVASSAKGTAPSPTRKPDGIQLDKRHLPRAATLQCIDKYAKKSGFVVLGSPPSTGKTSLLELLHSSLERKEANVIRYPIRSDDPAELIKELANKGITKDRDVLKKLKDTWLLIDDAQNAYDKKFNKFWEIVVKDGSAASSKGLFVVIAATFDLATTVSPVHFATLKHVDPNINEEEAKDWISIHLDHWKIKHGNEYGKWERFKDQVLTLSKIWPLEEASNEEPEESNEEWKKSSDDEESDDDEEIEQKYHIGVIMAAIRAVEDKRSRKKKLSEDQALDHLRAHPFTTLLDRCYGFDMNELTEEMKKYLQMALVSEPGSENYSASLIFPLIRAGILNSDGKFACFAANWYYNRMCFPNRPLDAPKTLRDLIIQSIGTMSATRLRQAVQNKRFPKEAAFQQLMNEAMSTKLPARHAIMPEFGTIAVDSQDSNAKPVTGELDFYVNGQLKWCIEMVRQGDGTGEHMGRFKKVQDSKGNKGKYRKVEMNEYYVVDCRSTKKGGGASLEPHKCVLYFAEDFTTCTCAIKEYPEVTIKLQM